MSTVRHLLATLLAAAAATTPLAAQGIRGRVLDAATGAGVELATVTAITAGQQPAARARTGATGEFTLALAAPGVYTLRVERTGYGAVASQAVTVGANQNVEVALRITAEAVTLEPVTAVGRQVPSLAPTGFYNREARGIGRFYRRDFVEKRINRPFANVLDEVPGIRLYRDRSGTDYVIFDRAQTTGTFRRLQKGEDDKCLPVFYLDGTRVMVGPRGTTASDLVQSSEVEAIEIYGSAAQLPAEFNGSDASCGVIVVWTRRGP